jgi:hypothetical protein
MGKRGSPFATELPRIEQRNAEIVRRYKAVEDLAGIGVDLDLTQGAHPPGPTDTYSARNGRARIRTWDRGVMSPLL